MAKLHEEVLVIKVSTLLRDDVTATPEIINNDVLLSLEAVIEELAGTGTLVEIQRA